MIRYIFLSFLLILVGCREQGNEKKSRTGNDTGVNRSAASHDESQISDQVKRYNKVYPIDFRSMPAGVWGETANGLACRITKCGFSPFDHPSYKTRIHLTVEVKNLSTKEQKVDFCVPYSGEPAVTVHFQNAKKQWKTGGGHGNWFVGPKKEHSSFSIPPGKVVGTTFSAALDNDEMAKVNAGIPLRCTVAYKMGPHDTNPLFSGAIVVPAINDTELEPVQKQPK